MQPRAEVLERGGVAGDFAAARALAFGEVDFAGPGPGAALIRIATAGRYHPDLPVINGTRPPPVPMVLGYEAAGRVIETGAGVDYLAPGDHVVCIFAPGCGRCTPCAEARTALRTLAARHHGEGALMTGHRRLSLHGCPLHHHFGVSAFASHAVLTRRRPLPASPSPWTGSTSAPPYGR